MERGVLDFSGGIAGLAAVISDHGGALNYDLMTLAGTSLSRCPGEFTWADIRDFVKFLPASSALVSEMEPELAGWQGNQKVPMLLAHIADQLAVLTYAYELSHTKKGAKKPPAPEPIPRPGVKPSKKRKHFGKGAVKISEFDAWWNAK